jgi:hypothetical protein
LEPYAPPIRTPNDGRACMRPCYPRGVRPQPSLEVRAYAPLGPPVAARAPWACAPLVAVCALPLPRAPPWPCVARVHAPVVVRAALCRTRLFHPCAPLPYAPPEYKSHKLVVHSTTWASRPLTTERWLIAGCLGGDHSFHIHSHSHAQGCTCMHVTFHVFLFIFIVNACQLGGHIKLLVSLYTF